MRRFASWTLAAVAWATSTLLSTPAWAGMVATPRSESTGPARDALAQVVRERAEKLGVSGQVPPRVLETATIAQLSIVLDALSSNTRAGQVEIAIAAVLAVLFVVFLIIILSPSGTAEEPVGPPPPPRDPVPPIRNCAAKVTINVVFSYEHDPAEGSESRRIITEDLLARLNSLGAPDGNTFRQAVGEQPNFIFNVTIYSDSTDHFSGSMAMSGWGWDSICSVDSGQYKFPQGSARELTNTLVDKAYGWIHNGWHENR